jgi:hypothetical protein
MAAETAYKHTSNARLSRPCCLSLLSTPGAFPDRSQFPCHGDPHDAC